MVRFRPEKFREVQGAGQCPPGYANAGLVSAALK
jgi:hypothetical protein